MLVPGVDDKDVDWGDDDLDLNDDDMTEEEVKLIMQNIAASSKEKAQDQGGGDLDVSLMLLFLVISAAVRTTITSLWTKQQTEKLITQPLQSNSV